LRFRKSTAISLLKDSWPLSLSGLVIMVYMRIDHIMIKEMLGAEAVGQYAAAVRISEAWYFVPTVISSSLFPAIINAKKVSEELYYARLQKLYNLMVWIAISVALPMTFLSDWVVNLLYGKAYSQAGDVLMIHIWAGVFVGLLVASGKWFINENLQILAFLRNFSGAVLNIVLNFILIPIYGINGAAVSTLISYSFSALWFDYFNKKTKKMFIIKIKSFLKFNSYRSL
ncbi:MAG: flippase, partial [Candidatus Aenigmatarchaeota archaeon]